MVMSNIKYESSYLDFLLFQIKKFIQNNTVSSAFNKYEKCKAFPGLQIHPKTILTRINKTRKVRRKDV